MKFQDFKLQIMNFTGLEKDALHIYIGIGVFLLTLLLTQPIFKRHLTRLNLALVMSTFFAVAGEYLDLRISYPAITGTHLENSLHDLINTCFWPYVLYFVIRWTSLFNKD